MPVKAGIQVLSRLNHGKHRFPPAREWRRKRTRLL